MKILMINSVCGIRSTGRICTDLAAALEARGHEVKIAYGRETVPESCEKIAVKIGSGFDTKLHGLEARLFDASGFGSKKATRAFIEWVKGYDPDIIHLHNLHGYYINIELLFDYLKTCGKRIIWTLHDCWAFTGHSPYCDTAGCEKWTTGCFNCPNTREYPAAIADRSKSNWAKKKALTDGISDMTIVTPSKWLAGLVKRSFLSQYPVKVINNGIDTSRFYPIESDFRKKHGIGNKKMLLGVSTSWDEMKGYSDYLKLADKLGERYIIVLVGLTAEQINNLPANVLGIEKTDSIEELAKIYTAADLFLNLSYCENYPTVNLESLACGTPVLTYNTGGSPESAYGGITVERGDIDAALAAVKNPDFPLDIREINSEAFSKEKMIEKYLTLMSSGSFEFGEKL